MKILINKWIKQQYFVWVWNSKIYYNIYIFLFLLIVCYFDSSRAPQGNENFHHLFKLYLLHILILSVQIISIRSLLKIKYNRPLLKKYEFMSWAYTNSLIHTLDTYYVSQMFFLLWLWKQNLRITPSRFKTYNVFTMFTFIQHYCCRYK